MALGTLGSTLNDELNRLANGGTYRDKVDMVDEALAAKQWANRENINPYSTDTVGILNEIAGLGLDKKNWLDFNGVCNYIAGTTGLPAAAALRQVYPTTDLLTGVASYYVDAAYPTGLTNTPGYVYLNGTSGNYMSTPDAAVLDITGDLDVRWYGALDDWTPAADMTFVAKRTTSNWSFQFNITTNGYLSLGWTTDGSTSIIKTPSNAVPFTDGQAGWVRATLDVDNGAGGNDVKMYTSTDGVTWTQLGGTQTTAGTTSIYSGTAPVEIGSNRGGANNLLAGKVYRAQIRSGIDGTIVFDANMANVSLTATSFTESSSNAATVTINGFRAYPQTADNLGAAGSLLPTTLGSSTAADSNDPKFLDFTGTNYVYLPGVASNNLSLADSNDFDITGDIDIRCQVALDDWTPAANTRLIGNLQASGTTGYALDVLTTGVLSLSWGANFQNSTVAPTISDGASLWVRATLDVDNGASGYDVKFFTSTNGTSWTQLGTTVTGVGTTSIVASANPMMIGQRTVSGDRNVAGKVFRAQIFNGIDGTKVLDVDTSTLQTGADAYIVPTTYSGAAGAFFTGTGLSLNGVAGNYVSTPDSSALDITGDIDIQCKVALTDWTPAAMNTLVNKLAASGNRSYELYVATSGKLGYIWSSNGTTVTAKESTVAAGITDGTTKWVRATHDVDNGASGNDIKFYTSDDGSTWTQLGATVTTAGTTSIYNSTAQLEIGTENNTQLANGTFYRAIVKSGIDGYPVFDATFVGVPANSLRMIESSTYKAVVTLNTTRYCTINRSTSGRKTVAVTQPTWLFGTDDYMEVNNRYMSSGTYLYLPGVAGNYASTPDAAALDITGDIDIRVKVAMDDWTPASASTLIGKLNATGNQKSYRLTILTDGRLFLQWSADGSAESSAASTVAPTVTDGSTLWIRAALDVDNGASGNTTTFFTSTDGTTWTQLGNTVTNAGVTSIYNSTSILEVGSHASGASSPARGKFFRAQVLNGIDGTVAFDANFETSITSLLQTSFTESSANAATVTINRNGSAYRSAGITAAGYLYPGATNTFTASATSFLDFGAADSFTAIAVIRQWNTPVSYGRYLAKNNSAINFLAYGMMPDATNLRLWAIIRDTGAEVNAGTVNYTVGSTSTLGMVVNRTAQTLTGYVNATAGTSTSIATKGSIATETTATFNIGRQNAGSNQDFEFVSAAVFRQALTASQIRQISNYFANREVYL